jgi:hypothetical protein
MSPAPDLPVVPVSWGELLDKITILEIKQQRIRNADARANVAAELQCLQRVARGIAFDGTAVRLRQQLRQVNEELWQIEDSIRLLEQRQDFGPAFIGLARSVYRKNDERAAIKRELNMLLGSRLVEEKSYAEMTPQPA